MIPASGTHSSTISVVSCTVVQLMSDERSTHAAAAQGPGRRVGVDTLLSAGADLLGGATLPELLSFAGVRAVAARAGVKPGTVTHHFGTGSRASRRPNPALAEAIARHA